MSEAQSKYKTWAKTAIVAITLITAFMAYQVSQIGFDYNFERFFPEGDPETEYYLEHREIYGTENDFILFSLENEAGIFDHGFLQEAKRLQDSLLQLNNIRGAESILSLQEPIKDPLFGSFVERPYFRWDEPEHYSIDSARIYNSPDLINSFVTADGKALAIVLNHSEYLSKEKCDTLAGDIEAMLPDFEIDRIFLSGRATGQRYFVDRMQWELAIFMSASILLITIFLLIAFRSLWGVMIPLIVVLLAIVWLLGIMQLLGKQIDLLLTIVPTILFVVGMSDVVHILSKYFDELRKGISKMTAIKTAVREVGIATFLTSLTTSIGFLTLMGSSIIPIREFGIYCAIGVGVAYVLAFTLLPATLVLSKKPKLRESRAGQDFWTKHLHRFYGWIIRQRKQIALGAVLLTLLCLYGISQIGVNNYLLEDLRKDDPLREQFDYFEEAYAGTRPFEMALTLSDTSQTILDPNTLRHIDQLDRFLREEYGAGFIVSPLNFVKTLNKASHNGKPAYYRLPESEKALAKLVKTIQRAKSMSAVSSFIKDDLSGCRLSGKMGDWGKQEIDLRNAKLEAFWQQEMVDSGLSYHLTGTAALIDLNNQYLSRSMIWGLVIAFLIVAIIVGLLYRSWRMVIISLIPNMLPLMMIGAVMGYTGIDLKVSTSIIFTIAFGIAVDDTIHFISRLRLELAKGRSRQYALKRSFIGTGKAIIITSLILVAGFLTLILSTFNGTFYTGALLSLTLLFAVLVDLLLLPVLFWAFYGEERKLQR